MTGFPGQTIRRVVLGAIAASWLGAAPLCVHAEDAPPTAPAETPSAIAVFVPRAPAVLRSVEGGVRLWLMQELRRGGIPAVDPGHTDRVAAARITPEHPFLRSDDVPELARATEASAVVLGHMQLEDGALEIWLRAYDAKGESLAVGHGSGRLASLGDALVASFAPLRAALGAGRGEGEPPRLAELGAYQRAMERIAAGSLALAWREIEGIQTPTADALRQDIVALSTSPDADAPERSRLASARGAHDPDWLAIRHRLQRERDAEALIAGGDRARTSGDPQRALVLYAEAAESDPNNVDAERGRAEMLTALERHADAKLAYERVLTLAPGDVPARVALANNPAVEKAAQAELWLEAGKRQSRTLDAEGARSSFERAMKLGLDTRAAARRHFARLEETMGNDLDAMAAWDEAVAEDGGDVEALRGLGRMRARTGDAAGAEEAFGRVVETVPDDVPALHGLGDALLAQGKAEAAVSPLEQVVAKAPADSAARTSLARALVETGDTDAALRALDPEAVPLEARSVVLSEAAQIHAGRGELAEAQAALVRAVGLEPDEPPLRSALAKVYEQAGDTEAASREQAVVARLSGGALTPDAGPASGSDERQEVVGSNAFITLAESFPQTTPKRVALGKVAYFDLATPQGWRERLRAWVLPRTVDPERLEQAIGNALRARFDIQPPGALDVPAERALAALRDGGTSRADVALLNDRLEVDAVFLARWVTPEGAMLFDPPPRPVTIELRLLGGRREADVFLSGFSATLGDPSAFVVWNWRAGACALGLLLLLSLPFLRGWGSLEVKLDYESVRGAQGFFSIELSRRPGRTKQAKDRAGRSKRTQYQRKNRAWSRMARHMVGRETRMSWLPARSWYVAVHGLLQDTNSQEVIGNYLEEKQVRIRRGETTQVAFDFRRKAAPIEVRIQREEGDKSQVRVAMLGVPDSLRFVKDDSATLFLDKGSHTLLIGVEDRVFERSIEVNDLTGQAVTVQPAKTGEARFSGSPQAVDAYLAGDLVAASEALEAAGQGEQALLMRAAHHQLRGETDEAALWLERAGRFGEAAELASQSPTAERSAALYEKAGDFHQAAERHAAAGDPLAAAQAYEAAFDYVAAIDAYRNAGANEKALELLEKTGRFYEAGMLALELGNEDAAIRCLQLVGARDPEYGEACEALAGLFEKRDAWDLAIDKARASIEAKGADEAPLDALEGLARLFERADRPAEALAVWENIRKRDFQYAGAGERVESLRQTVAATARATVASGEGETTAPLAPAATEPAREERYEILGELGRGGMGVVLRARDRRLGRVVALKRLPENLKSNPTAVSLFLREARAAASLSHPNIVTLFDADQQPDGTYYLTMELLEGFPLDGVVKKRGRLSVRDTLRIGVQIAKGLQFAHDNGVIHRDIKTANLFFTKDRIVKIMDFGLAKMTEEVRRSATVIGGTPYYMAPEQAAGEKVDHRTDLYALGVTLFELLTGAVPFRDGDITYHHRHTPPPDPRTKVSGVPDAMAELILRLLAKTAAERPETTAEVVRALEVLLAEQGAHAAGS
jgi:tetratricopeptide (TPR) repeat protein